MARDWEAIRAELAGKPVPERYPHAPGSWARRAYRCECERCLPSGRPPVKREADLERDPTDPMLLRQRHRHLWGLPVPDHVKHAPSSWAAKAYGCTCEKCIPSRKFSWKREEEPTGPPTARERRLKSRRKLKGTPVPPGTKHGIYTYQVYACRCPMCQAAHADQQHRTRNSWRQRARGRWAEGKDDTGAPLDVICWPPRGAGPDWTCPDPAHKET